MAEKRDDAEFLGRMRKQFSASAEDEKELRTKFSSDLKFASPDGDQQWDPLLKMQREQAGRPAMAFPRCHTFVSQVSNEARQNKPQIKFAPRLDADQDTAEIYEGLARFIQYESDAQIAYETAIEYSAGASFGYYRFMTAYAEDEGDEQELKILPVLDPLTVYGILVPACFNRKPKYAFVIEEIPKDEYKMAYPDSELASLPWQDAERTGEGWIGSESVRIAEYWWIEEKKVAGKRRPKGVVRFCKTNGMEILPGEDGETSETEWPGSSIAIIPVLGKQMIMDGKPQLFSVVRPQKAAQLLINYSKSRIAETLSTSPISPFMVVEGQISGYENEWANLNTSMKPTLTYKNIDVMGKPAGPPQRQISEPPIQSLSAFVAQEVDDMKATTGIFDASLGNKGNETSGQAIARRQQQSDLTTLHYMDNLARSFKKGGEIIAEIIPKIYDTAREIQILGVDEAPKIVLINKQHNDKSGQPKMFDMTKGKYNLVVTMGKAFDSKRMETFDTMQQVLATQPNLINMIGDIFFRNSDLAGADQLAERFKKMLPPQLQDQDGEPIPPQAQQQIAQAQHEVQVLNAACQHYEALVAQLQFEKKAQVVKSSTDYAMRKMEVEADLAKAEITTKAQNQNERITFVEDLIKQVVGQQHDAQMGQQQAQQDAALSQQGAQQQSGLATQQAQQQSQQSAQDAQQSQQQPEDSAQV